MFVEGAKRRIELMSTKEIVATSLLVLWTGLVAAGLFVKDRCSRRESATRVWEAYVTATSQAQEADR